MKDVHAEPSPPPPPTNRTIIWRKTHPFVLRAEWLDLLDKQAACLMTHFIRRQSNLSHMSLTGDPSLHENVLRTQTSLGQKGKRFKNKEFPVKNNDIKKGEGKKIREGS